MESRDDERLRLDHRAGLARKTPNLNHFLPLVWIPGLALIRHTFPSRPRVRNQVFLIGLGGALVHAGSVMFSDSTI